MGQLIEAGARINGKYNASRGFGPWATQAEAERGIKALKTELEYKQRYIEHLENRNGILIGENRRLAAQQRAHLKEKMRDYAKPRPSALYIEMALGVTMAIGVVIGLGIALMVIML